MNRNGAGSSIEWTTYSWNPVTGCKFGCSYCYAEALTKRFPGNFKTGFEPTFHPARLRQPDGEKAPARVFVCSMADLFGPWVPREWVERVLETVRRNERHVFQFLTKNPRRLPEFNPWPSNAWVGASVDVRRRLTPTLRAMHDVEAAVRWVSFEPLLEDMATETLAPLEWVVIGAQTGPGGRQPGDEWILDLTAIAERERRPVFFKDNITDYPETLRRFEFPTALETGQRVLPGLA